MAGLPSPENSPPFRALDAPNAAPSRKRQRSHSMESDHSSSSLKRSPRPGDLSNLSLSDANNNDNDIDAYMAEQGHDEISSMPLSSQSTAVQGPPGPEKYQLIMTKKNRTLKVGDMWYIVEKQWFERWRRACTGDFGKESPVFESDIGPVDNSEVIMDGYLLRMPIVEGEDMELVPEDAWRLLVQWYGEPTWPLPRKAITRGINQEISVELYPPRLRVIRLTKNPPPTPWPPKPWGGITHPILDVSISTTMNEMCSMFATATNNNEPPAGPYRVWKVKHVEEFDYPEFPHVAVKGAEPKLIDGSEKTVENENIQDEDAFTVEFKDADGWILNAKDYEPEDAEPPPIFGNGGFFDRMGSSSTSTTTVKPASLDSFSNNRQLKLFGHKEKEKALEPGTLGLGNMGNTCFMNSALQCLAHQKELVEYFLNGVYEDELNADNPLGMGGAIAEAFGALMQRIWASSGPATSYSPREFKSQLQRFAPQFAGYQQHDSQELVAFLLDGLHEDLNRVLKKPYVEKPDWEGGGDKELAELAKSSWEGYMKRNDSVIVDLFQGQYQSTLICPECQKVSITFDPFMYLTLPLPIQKKWQHSIFYIPWDVEKPHVRVPVEISANSTFKDLRALLGRWMGADPDNLLTLEIWSNKFYKNLNDNVLVGETGSSDTIVCFELPCHARQSRSYKAKKSDDDPFIVPVYLFDSATSSYIRPNTFGRSALPLFGYPMVIAISQDAAYSVDSIYDEVVKRLQRWTRQARELFTWEVQHTDNPLFVGAEPVLDSIAEINENGEVINVKEEPMIEEGDIVDEKNVVMNDDDAIPSSNPVPILRGPKKDLFELRLLPGHDDFGIGQYSQPRFEPWDARIAEVDKMNAFKDERGPILRDGDALYCEFDENMKAFYFGEDAKYEHALWGEWQDFIHPEYQEAMKNAGGKKSHQIDLEDCLDEFTKEEQLGEEDLWYCPRCKKHQQATKKFDLWKAPDVLVVHLKRFSNSRMLRDKIDAFIDFPTEGLDLGDRVGERSIAKRLADQGLAPEEFGITNFDQPLLYDLFAVDEHMGGLGGGHYRAYAQNHMNGKWYHFDDSYVTPARPTDAVNANAYLLFYRRRSQEPLGGLSYKKVEEASRQKPALEQSKGDDQQLPTPPSESASVSSSSSQHPPALDYHRLRASFPREDAGKLAIDPSDHSSEMGYSFPDPQNHVSPSSSTGVEADDLEDLEDVEDVEDSWSSAVSGMASPTSSVSDITNPFADAHSQRVSLKQWEESRPHADINSDLHRRNL